MRNEIYIAASAVISKGKIIKDGKTLFEQNDTTAAEFLLAAYQQLNVKYSKFYKMDHLSKLGWLAAEVLLGNSLQADQYKPEDVGIVLQNANASLDADLKYFESTKEFASPALFVYTLPNIVIGEICIRHHFKGENAFFIFENFEADFMHKYVGGLINNNILQACICGWADFVGEEYKAVLYLVEKQLKNEIKIAGVQIFTPENLNTIYQTNHG